MLALPKYIHHRHTGRLRPHHETSYGFSLFILLVIGVLLLGVSVTANASTEGSGQYTVDAVVTGQRPTSAPVITSPAKGQTFQVNPIIMSGTCPDRTLVKIFKNGILAGGVICGPGGRFSLQLDLLTGNNDLTAVAYNANDLPGPESQTVNVNLTAPAGGLGFSTELIIQSVNFYRGTDPGQEVVWPIVLVGGQAPYAVSFDWGDGTSDLVTRLAPGSFTLKHAYKKASNNFLNTFPLIIRATDAAGHMAFLQLTTIVSQAGVSSSQHAAKSSGLLSTNLIMIWPIWILLVLMLVSFWLGERREKRKMIHQGYELA